LSNIEGNSFDLICGKSFAKNNICSSISYSKSSKNV